MGIRAPACEHVHTSPHILPPACDGYSYGKARYVQWTFPAQMNQGPRNKPWKLRTSIGERGSQSPHVSPRSLRLSPLLDRDPRPVGDRSQRVANCRRPKNPLAGTRAGLDNDIPCCGKLYGARRSAKHSSRSSRTCLAVVSSAELGYVDYHQGTGHGKRWEWSPSIEK